MPVLLYALAALAYLAASWLSSAPLRGGQAPASARRGLWRGLLGIGLACHAGSLALPFLGSGHPLRFGFGPALSAAMWLSVALIWIESFGAPLLAIEMLVLPLAALTVWLPLAYPGSDVSALSGQPLFAPHLVVAMAGYSVLTIAALHAVLMAFAERALHGRGMRVDGGGWYGRWLGSLPPLLALERTLFRLIALGFVLLTLTVGSGILFGEETFGSALRWDHKTVFSLFAWLVFGILLLGRRLRGWRGRTALRMTLAGFALLLLAYAGSRFVLEVVLHRTA